MKRPVASILLSVSLVAATAASASAGEVADAAAQAEGMLAAGNPADIWRAFERATELFWAEAPLTFRTAILADDVTGYGQYRPRQGNGFAPGDTLTAYLEPVGYGWTAIGEEYRIRFTVDVVIATAGGDVIADDAGFAVVERVARTRSREFEATVRLTLPGLTAGAYVLSLTFHDASTGKSATATIPFGVSE
jgi:hypothetical protein